MRRHGLGVVMLLVVPGVGACGRSQGTVASMTGAETPRGSSAAEAVRDYAGFDLNEYPGDAAMMQMRKKFAYTGYWLTPPPGGKTTNWLGKRATLRGMGFGFLVLADGRFERQIRAAKLAPGDLGRQDAGLAVAAAKAEGFPAGTIIFLDQEEGGRLTDAQAGYLFGWTEAVAGSAYRPGVYASGQAVGDGPGATITTVADVRQRVAKGHLHEVAIWVYQDACAPKGPAPGCVLPPPAAGASGTVDVMAWQYAQSPRRAELTQSCGKTYAADGNCAPAGVPGLPMDLDVAAAADPSAGR